MYSTRNKAKRIQQLSDKYLEKSTKPTKTREVSAKKTYNKDSFDRFGDDLCQLLLSYLSIGERFRYECVSKQWAKLIYDSQRKVIISSDMYQSMHKYSHQNLIVRKTRRDLKESILNCALKKCRFISEICIDNTFKINGKHLDAIANNCRHLKVLNINLKISDFPRRSLKHFADKCANSLETIYLREATNETINTFFKLLPGIKAIFCTYRSFQPPLDISVFVNQNKPVLPNLKEIDLNEFSVNSIQLFADSYCKQIRKMQITLNNNPDSHYYPESRIMTFKAMDAFTQLARFENIDSLLITLCVNNNDAKLINNGLKLIGDKCKKLQELVIYGNMFGYETKSVSININNFNSLKKFGLQGMAISAINCPNLTFLGLDSNGLSDDKRYNLKDIHLCLPKLKSIVLIGGDNLVSDNTLRCLSKLPELSKIELIGHYIEFDHFNNVTDDGLCDFLANCESIRDIKLFGQIQITETCLQSFVELANRNSKAIYKFCFYCQQSEQISIENIANIPHNLLIEQTPHYSSKTRYF